MGFLAVTRPAGLRLRRAASFQASGMAAQHAGPVAIAVAEMAAAEGRFRAVIKLIVDAAMVRAIWPAGEILQRAMIAEPRRQLLGRLPVDADHGAGSWREIHLARATGRGRHGAGQNDQYKSFHHR